MSEKALKTLFLKFDKSGDGTLDAYEIRDLLSKIAPGISDPEIAEYVTKVGGDDQQVSFEEFYAEYIKIDIKDITDEQFEAEFRKLDMDGNGLIDAMECECLLSNCKGYTPEKAEEDMKRFDTDGDGMISLPEFLKMMKNK